MSEMGLQQLPTPSPFEANGSQPESGVKLVDPNQLIPRLRQSRRYFDAAKMQQLVTSIRECGIIHPLLVRPIGDNKYEIVAGERRYRAALELGLTQIPVTVRVLSDTEAQRYALMENLQRADLNSVEETEGILELLASELSGSVDAVKSLLYRMKNTEQQESRGNVSPKAKGEQSRGNVSPNPDFEKVEAVFAHLGKMSWQTFIRTRLPLLSLPPEILEALREGRIKYTKAKAIAQIKEESARKVLLEEAVAQSLSLSQIEARIKAQQLPSDRGELQERMEAIPKKIKKLKAWDDPDKRDKIESLLRELEALLLEEEQ